MLYPSKKLIHIHIPRTAGQSIKKALGGASRRIELSRGHLTAIEERDSLGKACFKANTKFAVVRNPWDKLVSEYFCRQRKWSDWRDFGIQPTSFSDFIERLDERLEGLIATDRKHFFPQSHFLFEGNKNLMDFTFKFEDLDGVESLIGKKLEYTNSSREHEHYSEFYSPRTRKIVERLFDIEIGRYEFEFRKK